MKTTAKFIESLTTKTRTLLRKKLCNILSDFDASDQKVSSARTPGFHWISHEKCREDFLHNNYKSKKTITMYVLFPIRLRTSLSRRFSGLFKLELCYFVSLGDLFFAEERVDFNSRYKCEAESHHYTPNPPPQSHKEDTQRQVTLHMPRTSLRCPNYLSSATLTRNIIICYHRSPHSVSTNFLHVRKI